MRIVKGNEFRRRSLYGLKELSDTVGSTLGINGNNVIFPVSDQHFVITKDGVTVAEHFYITQDSTAHAATIIAKQAARQTNDLVGDGTTTSTLLSYKMYDEALQLTGLYPKKEKFKKLLPARITPNIFDSSRYDKFPTSPTSRYDYTITPREFRDAIDEYVFEAESFFLELSSSLNLSKEDIVKNVAKTSSNGDETISELLYDAFSFVDMDGVVVTETSTYKNTGVEVIDGFKLEALPKHPVFLDPNTGKRTLKNAVVIISDKYIENPSDVQKMLTALVICSKPFLWVVGDISDSLLVSFVEESRKKGLNGVIVKAPAFGEERAELLYDLSAVTGATYLDAEAITYSTVNQSKHFGAVSEVEIDMEGIRILDHMKDPDIAKEIELRVSKLEAQIRDEKDMPEHTKRKIEERASNLKGKFAKINFKVETEAEGKEVNDRLEDALCAVKHALKNGVIPGGGVSLIMCAKVLSTRLPDNPVIHMMYPVLQYPLEVMLSNSKIEPYIIKQAVKEVVNHTNMNSPVGIELRTMKFCNLVEAGILDPVGVAIESIKNAASVTKTLLQTDYMMSNE